MADITLLAKYGTYEEELMGHVESITAFAGGGQANATPLTFKWNTIDTCASDYDSVKLIISKQGYQQVIFNNTANIVSVFPVSGESINGITDNEVFIPAGMSMSFECSSDGEWIGYANFNDVILSKKVTLTSTEMTNLFSSPVVAVAASGAGYATQVIGGSIRYVKGGANYSNGGQIYLKTDTASNYQMRNDTIPSNTNFFELFGKISGQSAPLVENKDLVVTCANNDFTAGNGTVYVYIQYKIVQL